MPAFTPDLTKPIDLPKHGTWPESRHRFDPKSVWAIRAALESGRPLLLRGEPGIGKSQLARAAAVSLRVPFLYHVVDERSERDDLLYAYDAISRLAEAQVSALIVQRGLDWETRLDERNFIRPGVLWWAFNWASAKTQAERYAAATKRKCPEPADAGDWLSQYSDAACGPVVLVDEIDKADPSVPNGLLESLGNEGFQTAQLGEEIRLPEDGKPPLVIITTNEERELPAAFLRRCLVLQMRFPKGQEAEKFLIERARVFLEKEAVSDAVCKKIVADLLRDRELAHREGLAIPGAAEFLDIVRVLASMCPGNDDAQFEALGHIGEFALRKNLDEAP